MREELEHLENFGDWLYPLAFRCWYVLLA